MEMEGKYVIGTNEGGLLGLQTPVTGETHRTYSSDIKPLTKFREITRVLGYQNIFLEFN